MRLSDVMQYINSALNYPAITYIDVSLFFDMAVAELNTTLHTSIPSVSRMVEDFRNSLPKYEADKVILHSDPGLLSDPYAISVDPENPLDNNVPFYYDSTSKKFYILHKLGLTKDYSEHDTIKAVWIEHVGSQAITHIYQSMNYGTLASWMEIPIDPAYECNLEVYFPDDWILLWMIPYVCFKYTTRDGGTAQTFAEELSQGYQQLQETYDIPSKVELAKYADRPAYTEIVEANLPNLKILVPTRAIYEDMKHDRNVNAIYGSFYDRGGF